MHKLNYKFLFLRIYPFDIFECTVLVHSQIFRTGYTNARNHSRPVSVLESKELHQYGATYLAHAGSSGTEQCKTLQTTLSPTVGDFLQSTQTSTEAPIHLPIQWVRMFLTRGKAVGTWSWSLTSLKRLRIFGALPPLPYIPSRRAASRSIGTTLPLPFNLYSFNSYG
jgi:hypothetical protein